MTTEQITETPAPAVNGRGETHISGGEDFTGTAGKFRLTGHHTAACGAVRGYTLRVTTGPVTCERCIDGAEIYQRKYEGGAEYRRGLGL